MNLADNHDEYWKVIDRLSSPTFAEATTERGLVLKMTKQSHQTIGFPWFATWPATKRTRKSPKALKTNLLAWWHCTRKQLVNGKVTEIDNDRSYVQSFRRCYGNGHWAPMFGLFWFTAYNRRQGWDKDGNAVEWPWKEGK